MFWNKDKKKSEEEKEELKNIAKSFSGMKSDVEISPKVQSEYIAYHDRVNTSEYSEEYMLSEGERIVQESVTEEEAKRILFILVHIGTLPCVKSIERFLQQAEGDLKSWAMLAFQEGWVFLESEGMGVDKGIILGGAGGDGERLRYYFSVRSKKDGVFTKEQEVCMKEVIDKVALQYDARVEDVSFEDEILLVFILVPMDVAVGKVIENIIKASNAKCGTLNSDYFLTNLKKPDWEEVKRVTPK